MKLAGKTALVTGSSRGIGKAIALRLGRCGADVAVNCRSETRQAEEVAEQIRSMGRRAVVLQADVSKHEEANALAEEAARRLGAIGILVNNVGEFFFKPLAEMQADEWLSVLGSNLSSAFHMSRAVLPSMRKQRRGRIVNIGLSPSDRVRGAPNIAAYAIAKSGVLILTRSLASEEAPYGIAVNCVSPGLIDNGYLPPAQREWMERRVPMGRLGRPDEVAQAVAFLASERAAYISGANLSVSGAWDWEDRPTDHDELVNELFLESDTA